MELIAANALYFRAKKGSIFYLLPNANPRCFPLYTPFSRKGQLEVYPS
jgi:hypothetical protein